MRSFKIFILVLFLCLPAYAQIDCYVPSKITVKSPDGDLVSNAKVWLFNVAADKTRTFVLEGQRKDGEDFYVVASAMGQFEGVDGRFWRVTDDYFIRILAPGFKTYEQEAKFHHCRGTDLEITLKPLKSGRSKK